MFAHSTPGRKLGCIDPVITPEVTKTLCARPQFPRTEGREKEREREGERERHTHTQLDTQSGNWGAWTQYQCLNLPKHSVHVPRERERERERERDRETERQRERQRHRDRDRQRQTETDRYTDG